MYIYVAIVTAVAVIVIVIVIVIGVVNFTGPTILVLAINWVPKFHDLFCIFTPWHSGI
jgi:hypothetical protein